MSVKNCALRNWHGRGVRDGETLGAVSSDDAGGDGVVVRPLAAATATAATLMRTARLRCFLGDTSIDTDRRRLGDGAMPLSACRRLGNRNSQIPSVRGVKFATVATVGLSPEREECCCLVELSRMP